MIVLFSGLKEGRNSWFLSGIFQRSCGRMVIKLKFSAPMTEDFKSSDTLITTVSWIKEFIMVGYFTAEFLKATGRQSEYPGNYQVFMEPNPWDQEMVRLRERFPDPELQIVVMEVTVCEEELPDFRLREEEVEQGVESSVAVTEDRGAKLQRIRAKMAQKTDEYSPIKVVIQPPKQAPKRKIYRYPYKVPMSRRHGRRRR
jgi:hypothetical protein